MRRRRAEARKRGRCLRPSTAGRRSSGAAPPCASAAAQGRPAEARALADELVAILADIDYPGIEFHARLDAAEGYRAAGEREAAEALLRRAIADSDEREATEYARQAAAALDRVRG